MGFVFTFALLAVTLLLFAPALGALATLWRDTVTENYTGGFLIAALCVWLLWRVRWQLAGDDPQTPRAARIGAAVVLAALVMGWQLAFRAGLQLGYLVLLPPILLCVLYVARGWRATRSALFPIGFLVFALPVWDLLMPVLQWITVRAVRAALRVSGVPAFFDASIVQIPSGSFEIRGGCGGLHYFIVALALAALIGQLRRDPWRVRLRWLLIAGTLAMLANWVRVYTIIVMGHVTHMQSYLVRVSHYGYGWAIFMLAEIAFLLLVRRMAAPLEEEQPRQPPTQVPAPGYAFAALALALVALPTLIDHVIELHLVPASRTEPGALSASRGDWRAAPGLASAWRPQQLGADREFEAHFLRGAQAVEVYVATYVEQYQRKKLGGVVNRPGGDGAVLDRGTAQAGVREFATEEVLDADGTRSRLWLRYQVGERTFSSATRAQLWYSLRSLATLRSPTSNVWILRARCASDCDSADLVLTAFADQYGNLLWPDPI